MKKDTLIEEILKEFDEKIITESLSNGYREILGNEFDIDKIPELKTFIRHAAKKICEAMITEEKPLPKRKCLNAENHLFGSCFQCERINGWNRAREAQLELKKKILG